ncbi:putative regulator [Pseudonocardia sp. Ae406_Ps2]|uniref:SsgA family sporulation/cell division regulator n=1 Tax=unclassified Pseudonocardia TaxID=2619320 RepID=UPI0002E6AC72|nr:MULTISPECIES: SsgA family sporulation/cell division regulator [unclassified Pseudonocardia]ALE83074.1 sporulation protein SsgA [Pseudonocardia sp. HH130629-09]KAA1036093.1 SsgA family sporulation/cell division regulator [Pseudonocardia sp. EV170527-09]OLM01875.1 putative regulator [Pseudonocardia sp. Ae406_Ps2]OLM06344.1 putative regulator [Pseudonocardia sp. Ae331_Ps2]OLM23446.1 putative regulator [Pseudonocardia sp. Ae706_Ps2]
MASESVQQDVFTVLHGQASPIVSRWAYRAADPFAISFSVRRSSDRWIEWLVARDLVIEGLTTPTGIGDIRMAPRRIDGYDVVELEIRSDGGSAVLEVDRDLLAQFVDSTLEIVDLGEEHDHLDIDGAIARLTGSAAGPTTP